MVSPPAIRCSLSFTSNWLNWLTFPTSKARPVNFNDLVPGQDALVEDDPPSRCWTSSTWRLPSWIHQGGHPAPLMPWSPWGIAGKNDDSRGPPIFPGWLLCWLRLTTLNDLEKVWRLGKTNEVWDVDFRLTRCFFGCRAPLILLWISQTCLSFCRSYPTLQVKDLVKLGLLTLLKRTYYYLMRTYYYLDLLGPKLRWWPWMSNSNI